MTDMNDDLTQPNGRTVPTSPPAESDTPAERSESLDLTQAAAHVSPPESAVQQATRVYIPPPLPKNEWLPAKPLAPTNAAHSVPQPVRQTATPGYLYVLIALGVVGIALVFSLGAFLLRRSVDSAALAQTSATDLGTRRCNRRCRCNHRNADPLADADARCSNPALGR